MEYSAGDWEANVNAGIANRFIVGGGDVNSEFRGRWIGRFGILLAVGGFILSGYWTVFPGKWFDSAAIPEKLRPSTCMAERCLLWRRAREVPRLLQSGTTGKISLAFRSNRMSLHFYSNRRIGSTVLCGSANSCHRSVCEVPFEVSRCHFGGVSLRATDAAADSPKRMIAPAEYIRCIFVQEEAWGFRPTPSTWDKSLIR